MKACAWRESQRALRDGKSWRAVSLIGLCCSGRGEGGRNSLRRIRMAFVVGKQPKQGEGVEEKEIVREN